MIFFSFGLRSNYELNDVRMMKLDPKIAYTDTHNKQINK